MKSAEKAYDDLKNKLLSKLPLYIEEINKKYNDGIILEQFTNTGNPTAPLKLPYWKINFETAEYSEKDILIETSVYKFSIELHAIGNGEELMRKLWRYGEAIGNLGIIIDLIKHEKCFFTIKHS